MIASKDVSNETISPPEVHCTITARIKQFSDGKVHVPGGETSSEFFECQPLSGDYENLGYALAVYANGRDALAGGYVSVVFKRPYYDWDNTELVFVDMTCVIAVVDASGDRRFPRSFEMISEMSRADNDPDLALDDYVPRRLLLEENGSADELLPGDTLTLHLDVCLKRSTWSLFTDFDIQQMLDDSFFRAEGGEVYMFLDSPFAQRLAQVSRYFERLPVIPMAERHAGLVRIPDEEYSPLLMIGRILFGTRSFTFESVGEILDLYTTADKYCIDIVLDICRSWLRLCLAEDNVREISVFAESYGDDRLKEAVRAFLAKSSGDGDDDPEAVEESWSFERGDLGSHSYLSFGRLNLEEKRRKTEREGYDFYF